MPATDRGVGGVTAPRDEPQACPKTYQTVGFAVAGWGHPAHK